MPIWCMTPDVVPSRAVAVAKAARAAYGRRAPPDVRVVPGAAAPRVEGSRWHYETKGGTYISHPSAYSKVGWSNMTYVPSSRMLVVGANWKRTLPDPAPGEVWAYVGVLGQGPDALFAKDSPELQARSLLRAAPFARRDRVLFRAMRTWCRSFLDWLVDETLTCAMHGAASIDGAVYRRVMFAIVMEAARRGGLHLEQQVAAAALLLRAFDSVFAELVALRALARRIVSVEAALHGAGIDVVLSLPLELRAQVDLLRLGL